jgi:hypothetical protein
MALMSSVARRRRWIGKLVGDLRSASAESGTSVGRMMWDLLVLNATHQLGVRAYFQYRLFDPHLTMEQKSRYPPDSKIATDRLWSLLTPREYRLPFATS